MLRHQLDELSGKVLYFLFSAVEGLPITSPLILEREPYKCEQELTPDSTEASLLLYRFCVDFRYPYS